VRGDTSIEVLSGLKPLVSFVSFGVAGVEPSTMGEGPVPATEKALKNANSSL